MGVFKRFKADQSGATAMIFGLALIPLIGLAGAAVDYSRASMAQTKIQVAIDQAALSIVKLPLGATQATMDAIATNAVESHFGFSVGTRSTSGITLNAPQVERTGAFVTVRATGTSDSAFMQILGIPTTPIGAASEAKWAAKKIEIALVLDNTKSMDETKNGKRKMDELVSAAKRFVNDAKAKAIDTNSIRISIVPFDSQVRVNTASVSGQSWFRFVDTTSDNWRGYFIDRFGTYAGSDAEPTTDSLSKYPATKSRGGDLPTILPLTSVLSGSADMTAKIDAMQPRDTTNIALGVTWGTATLSAGAPFTEASTDPNVQRFMIVFTDGTNTAYHKDGTYDQARNLTNPSPTDPVVVAVNANTLQACTEAKKIATVYTIRLLQGDAGLLTSCASKPGYYQDVSNPADLTAAFKKILEDILGTRITS